MRHRNLLIAAVLACGAGTAQATETDLTVFGLEIGKPILLAPCGSGINELLAPDLFPCIFRTAPLERIYFPKEHPLPLFVRGNSVIPTEIRGMLAGVRMETLGNAVQSSVFDALVSKYGSPSSKTARTVQNGFGAQFQSIDAEWRLPDLIVVLLGITIRTDSGQVTIETPEAAEIARHSNPLARPGERQL